METSALPADRIGWLIFLNYKFYLGEYGLYEMENIQKYDYEKKKEA